MWRPEFLFNNSGNLERLYCSENWDHFWHSYDSAHDYIILVITFLGCLTNICNIWVFTRKHMKNAINFVLTALALADFLVMLNGLWKQIYLLVSSSIPNQNYGHDSWLFRGSYAHAVLELIYEIAYYLFVTWSIYLTVLISAWRFVGVSLPFKSRLWLTERRAKWSVFWIIVLGIILIPFMFFGEMIKGRSRDQTDEQLPPFNHKFGLRGGVNEDEEEEPEPETEYHLTRPKGSLKSMGWIYGLGIKMIPCVILIICTFGIIVSMTIAKRRRNEMVTDGSHSESTINDTSISHHHHHHFCEFDKTTRMLFYILIIFILTELPDAIVCLTFVIANSKEFRRECFRPISNFLVLLEFTSSALSFFVYIRMSGAFWRTLVDTFKCGKTKTKPEQKSWCIC